MTVDSHELRGGRRWRPRRRGCLGSLALVLMSWAAPHDAVGQGVVRLDDFVGPLVNGSRVVGLGGAYAAIAEGIDGVFVNPAAIAVRPASFADEWFDWDVGFSSLHTVGGDIQLDRSPSHAGAAAGSGSAQVLGLRLSFGRFAISLQAVVTEYALVAGTGAESAGYSQSSASPAIGLGWAFGRGEWVVGTVIQGDNAALTRVGTGGERVTFGSVFAPRGFGVLWAPHGRAFRLGGAVQLPVRMTQPLGETWGGEPVTKLGKLRVPNSIDRGASLTLGAVWQLVGHSGNRPATFGEMSPPRLKWRGPPVIIASDVVVTGPVADGFGVLGYLHREHDASGRRFAISPRVGVESELLERRLRVRTGAYFEPSRFESTRGRVHWTGGSDVRLSVLLDWRLGVFWDLASHYRNVSLSVGLWH